MTVAKKHKIEEELKKRVPMELKKVVGKFVLFIKFNMLGVMAWKSHII